MSAALDRDLERWEHGALSMSELVALHGSEGAAGLVALHRRMSALGTAPVGDPGPVWRAIRERLADVAAPRRTGSLRRRLTRPLAIAAAAVLVAGTAYASAPDSIQRSLTSFWDKVQAVLEVDVAGEVPADADRPSQGGTNGDGAVDDGDLVDRDDEEANGEDEGSGGLTDGDDRSDGEGDVETGSDDDGEGPGADEGDDDREGDDRDGSDDDRDESGDDGGSEDDDGDESEDDDPGSDRSDDEDD
jgi:hypothetical protein